MRKSATAPKLDNAIQIVNRLVFVDQYVELDKQIKALQNLREELAYKIRDLGCGTHQGSEHEVQVITVYRTSLDNDKVKVLLTPAQIVECAKQSSATQIRVKF